MKILIFLLTVLIHCVAVYAQTYPEPEFSNEVYYLKKDSAPTVMRLSKESSKIETKTKLGGMGGSESAYVMEGAKATARVPATNSLSFVYSTGATAKTKSNDTRDSMMRANGMDPSMLEGMGSANDPSQNITLFKLEVSGGKRKVLLQKNPGMSPFGSKKQKSSTKYSFSVRKVRDGYWELVIDKTLPSGEYAFTMNATQQGSVNSMTTLFAFGVD